MPPATSTSVRVTGATDDQIQDEMIRRFVEAVISDLKAMPHEYPGTPFLDTGALERGLVFHRASSTGRRAGLIGTVRAPRSRLARDRTAESYLFRFGALWRARGIGWSRPDLRRGKGG